MNEETMHVLPINDLREHVRSMTCPCQPYKEMVKAGWMIVHNAFDGREFNEQAEQESHDGH